MDLIGINQQLKMLTALQSTWASPTLRLFVNNVTVGPNDVLANYTEPTGASWYSAEDITFGTPFVDSANLANTTSNNVQWTYGESVSSSVTVYGAFTVSDGTDLVSSYNFPQPINMGSAGNAVLAASQIQLPQNPQTPFAD